MKKILLITTVLLGCLAAKAQDIPEKPEVKGEPSNEMSALRLASDLVKYGYAQQSALPLIDALNIIIENPTQPLNADKEAEDVAIETSDKNGNITLDFAEIIASAKQFADGDETLMALLTQVENDAEAPSRGAVNGPKYTVDVLGPNRYTTYNVSFVAGYIAEVGLSGDGDTDLDLYVYDSNGNLIVADESYSDDCYVNWVPAWTGRYTIKVVNRGGVANKFVLLTN